MIRIENGDYQFRVQGMEIEGANDVGVDVQYPWEDSPRRFHEHPMQIKPIFIDRCPVTNAEFKKFIDATHYQPKDGLNFLKDWKDGTYPDGWVSRQGNSFSPGFRVSLKGHLVCCPISPVFDCVGAYRSRDSRFFALGKARHVPV
jgi:formylglycine-generating enzyme required for sulfatase activity